MVRDKYTAIFLRKMEAVELIILQIFMQRENVYEHEANVCCVGCVFFSVFSHDFMNKQACIFFCDNS